MAINLAKYWRASAVVFTVLTVLFGAWYWRLQWRADHPDFDILGVTLILFNLGPITALLLTLVCGLGALMFWVRYLLSDR